MLNLRPFQIVLLGLFVFMAIGAVVLLTTAPTGSDEEVPSFGNRVLIWGTLEAGAITDVFNEIEDDIEDFRVVSYQQVPEWQFEDELVNAIAEGRSPDMILISSENVVSLRSKLRALSYEMQSVRTFRDSYIDAAEVFMFDEGFYAVPLAVDPLMMVWNRDLFAQNGLVTPPSTWEMVVGRTVPAVTKRNSQRTILQSAVAFGVYENVRFAKEILLTLALQSGSAMTIQSGNRYEVLLNESTGDAVSDPLESAAQFYTSFSNPNNSLYSWNRTFGNDEQQFAANDLGMYFLPASAIPSVIDRNPNLNFDVAPVPQGAGANERRVYGNVYGFAIPQASRNSGGAYAVAQLLARSTYTESLTSALNLAPVRRDILARSSADPIASVVYNQALISRAWLDPDPIESDQVFDMMINDITSNRERLGDAVSDAVRRISNSY